MQACTLSFKCPRAPSPTTRAHDCAAPLWARLKGAIFVLRFNNFYRRWFHPTPHESNTLLNCTAIVVAPVRKAIEFLWGLPSLAGLQFSTAEMRKLLATTQVVFMSALSYFAQNELPPPSQLVVCWMFDERQRTAPNGIPSCFQNFRQDMVTCS